jgi:glucose/arabinose dehydrogenase
MRRALIASLTGGFLACAGLAWAQSGTTPSSPKPFNETVVADFDSPWAMAFLPDRRMFVTEKDGRLLLVAANGASRRTVTGTPAVDSAGQGGLMDVVPHPGFARNRLLYFSASQAGSGGKGVVLFAARFVEDANGSRVERVRTVYRATPLVSGDGHYSGKIAFSRDGHLFFTVGDRQKGSPAQDKAGTLGKVIRLLPNGTVPTDNPLTAMGFDPAIWSYGHRNLYGLAFDRSGNLWEHEMGPEGGDEFNLVLPGRNYGWPNASNGSNYGGGDIPDHRSGDGYEAPKVWWNPSISPAGMMIYNGTLFRGWRGDAFLGGLSGQALIRIDLNGVDARKAEQWSMGARIREVEQAPDGSIYLLQDGGSGGRMIRLTPKA